MDRLPFRQYSPLGICPSTQGADDSLEKSYLTTEGRLVPRIPPHQLLAHHGPPRCSTYDGPSLSLGLDVSFRQTRTSTLNVR